MIDPKTFLNAFNSANEGQYYSIDDLDPIVCGRSGIYLEPIAPDVGRAKDGNSILLAPTMYQIPSIH